MFRPDYKVEQPSSDWRKDLETIRGQAKKMKQQTFAMSKEGRELHRNSREMMRIAADRRKRAEELRSEGRTAKQITEFLKTGKEPVDG